MMVIIHSVWGMVVCVVQSGWCMVINPLFVGHECNLLNLEHD